MTNNPTPSRRLDLSKVDKKKLNQEILVLYEDITTNTNNPNHDPDTLNDKVFLFELLTVLEQSKKVIKRFYIGGILTAVGLVVYSQLITPHIITEYGEGLDTILFAVITTLLVIVLVVTFILNAIKHRLIKSAEVLAKRLAVSQFVSGFGSDLK